MSWAIGRGKPPQTDGLFSPSCTRGLPGRLTLEAAEAVCAGDGLAVARVPELLTALVGKSLVTADDQGGRMRYRLLETVRQYALGLCCKNSGYSSPGEFGRAEAGWVGG